MYYDCMFADKHSYPADPQDPADEADGLKTYIMIACSRIDTIILRIRRSLRMRRMA